ncbi:MAG: hypothetical protein R3C99_18365 [Pirellulaceae bacterium]
MQMRKVWLVAATLLCAWHASAGSAQAGPLLDWLTGWFRGYPYQPADVGLLSVLLGLSEPGWNL